MMKLVVFKFNDGMACVIHSDETRAISFLTNEYGSIPDLVHTFSVTVSDQPPKILAIAGRVPVSPLALIKKFEREVQSDIFDFKTKVPGVDVMSQSYENSDEDDVKNDRPVVNTDHFNLDP